MLGSYFYNFLYWAASAAAPLRCECREWWPGLSWDRGLVTRPPSLSPRPLLWGEGTPGRARPPGLSGVSGLWGAWQAKPLGKSFGSSVTCIVMWRFWGSWIFCCGTFPQSRGQWSWWRPRSRTSGVPPHPSSWWTQGTKSECEDISVSWQKILLYVVAVKYELEVVFLQRSSSGSPTLLYWYRWDTNNSLFWDSSESPSPKRNMKSIYMNMFSLLSPPLAGGTS